MTQVKAMPFTVHYLLPQSVDVLAADIGAAAKMIGNIMPEATVTGVVVKGADSAPLAPPDVPRPEQPKKA